jgi:hypothetical protein
MEFFKSPIYLSADHQHLTQENWNSLNSWCTVRKVKLDGTSVLTLQDSVKLPKDLIRALHHRTLKAVRILAPDVNQQVAAPTVVKFSSLGLDPKSITPTANLGGSLPGTKDLVINLDVNLKHPRMLFGQLECRTSVVASMRSVTIIANKVSEYIPEKPLFNPYSLNVPPFGILDKALSTLNGSANQCSGKLKVILVGFEALPKSLLGISDGAFGSLTDLVAASAMKMHIRLNIVFVPRIAYIQEVGRDRWNFENVKHYSWWDASNSI